MMLKNAHLSINTTLSLIIALAFLSCQPTGESTETNGIHIGLMDSLQSEILGEMRQLYVHIPGNPSTTETSKAHPVLYLLDGRSHFHSVSGLVDQLSAIGGNNMLPEMMVVAILNTNRSRDLTPTQAYIDFWTEDSISYENGGGQEFLAFIEKELIPYIDEKYPTASNRTFVGHSFGGISVLNALIEKPELFQQYIAIDPSLWWDNRVLIERAKEKFTFGALDGRSLFVSIAKTPPGEVDLATIEGDTSKQSYHLRSILKFCQWLEEAPDNGLDFAWKYYPEDNHGSVPLISEYDGLRFLFSWFAFSDINRLFAQPEETSRIELVGMLEGHYQQVSSRIGYKVLPEVGLVNDLGYFYLERNLMDKAKAFFEMNLENFPEEADPFDSMGDYYLAAQDTANAITYFKKGAEMGLDYSQAKLDNLLEAKKEEGTE